MKHKMLSLALLFGILVLLFSTTTAQATPAFVLAENVGVQVGDTWSYTSTQGSYEESWPVAETDFVEAAPTAFGPLIVVVHIDYLDYWEFEYEPERSVANISFGIGDLSETDISHIEITSSCAYVCNRTWDSNQQEYVRDTILGYVYPVNLRDTILRSYDSVQANELELNWNWYNIDTKSDEMNAYLEFRVWFTVYDKYSADYEYWFWLSAPYDEERPDIDIHRRGTHDQTGYYNFEVSTVGTSVVTFDIDYQMSNSWGDVMGQGAGSEVANTSHPWTTALGLPFIQSTDWVANEVDFVNAVVSGADDYSVEHGDRDVLGRLTPYHSFWYVGDFGNVALLSGDVVSDYSSKSGVLIYVYANMLHGSFYSPYDYVELILSSASFEFAYTEPDLSLSVSRLSYEVESGDSFDVDCIVLNDGELAGDFSLELVGAGFSGSYSGTAESGQMEVTMTIATGADLDAGTYNVNIRLIYDGTPVGNKDIVVQVNVDTTTTTTTTTDTTTTPTTTTSDDDLTTDGVDIPIALVAGGGIILAIVVIVVLSKRKKH